MRERGEDKNFEKVGSAQTEQNGVVLFTFFWLHDISEHFLCLVILRREDSFTRLLGGLIIAVLYIVAVLLFTGRPTVFALQVRLLRRHAAESSVPATPYR
jgi:hypothetical protein